MKPRIILSSTKERFFRRALLLSTPADHLRRATQEGDLRKCLGLPELTFLGTGSIIGAGVFVLSGVAAKESAGPSVILSYVVAALAALLSAFAYSEFACDVPVAGGAFNYISITFGELAAWTTGWNMILETTLSSAAVSRGFASYLCTLLGRDPSTLRPSLGPFQLDFVALGLICLLSALLAAGTHLSAKFNMSVSMSVMACILFVLCAGFPVASVSNLSPFFPRGIRGMFSAASMVFFAFVGFDYVANAAEEARNPTRDLPISIVVSLGVATLLYVLMSTAIVSMVPTPRINVHAPFSDAFLQHGMLAVARLVSVGALLGIVTSTMTGLLSQARLYVVLGRQCLLPSWLARVHKTRGTPVQATLVTAVFAGVLALLLDINLLAELVSIGTLYVFMMVCCGVLWRRYHQPGIRTRAVLVRLATIALASAGFSVSFTFAAPWPVPAAFLLLWLGATLSCYALPVAYRPLGFRMPLSPLSPALGVLFTVHLIGSLGWMAYVRFVVWMLLGLVIYAGYGVHAADEREHLEARRRLDPEGSGQGSHAGSGIEDDGDGDGAGGRTEVELPRLSSLDPEGPMHRGAVAEGALWDTRLAGDSERLSLLKRTSGPSL